MYKRIKFHLFVPAIFVLLATGCSKLLDVDSPRNHLTTDRVFEDSISAVSAIGNIYYLLANNLNSEYNKHMSLYTDEYAYTASGSFQMEFFFGLLSNDNSPNTNIWSRFYEIIFSCNDILIKVPKSTGLSDSMKGRLVNEAKFVRAFCYYHLYALYENVPLILETDVDNNRIAAQSDSTAIFNQILDDLNNAKNGLEPNHPDGSKSRANTWSAGALLAQVYLFQNRWQEAFEESNNVLNSGLYTPIENVNNVFLSTSTETILHLWRLNGFISDGATLIPSSRTIVPQFVATELLLSLFEEGDSRRHSWFGENQVLLDGQTQSYWFPYKYKNRSADNNIPEYLVLLRASEQYLIRAEARAHLGDLTGAIADLNVLRVRAGLESLSEEGDLQRCLRLVSQERRVELFGEWAKRFIDLKRTGDLNAVMGNYKSTWINGTSERLPIPMSEITYNKNLNQNVGY